MLNDLTIKSELKKGNLSCWFLVIMFLLREERQKFMLPLLPQGITLARPLGALHSGQGLVSSPGPPNLVSVHLWHPTRVEHTWQPTRSVLGGTGLHIQHENISSIDSKNERLNLRWRSSFFYPSICPFISDTSVIKFSKTSSLWVLTSDFLLFGNGELGTFSSKVCHRLSRSCSFIANTFLDHTFQKFDRKF